MTRKLFLFSLKELELEVIVSAWGHQIEDRTDDIILFTMPEYLTIANNARGLVFCTLGMV